MDPPPPVAAVKGRARGRARGRPRDPNSDASGTEDSTGSRPGSVWSLASSSLADSFGSQSQLRDSSTLTLDSSRPGGAVFATQSSGLSGLSESIQQGRPTFVSPPPPTVVPPPHPVLAFLSADNNDFEGETSSQISSTSGGFGGSFLSSSLRGSGDFSSNSDIEARNLYGPSPVNLSFYDQSSESWKQQEQQQQQRRQQPPPPPGFGSLNRSGRDESQQFPRSRTFNDGDFTGTSTSTWAGSRSTASDGTGLPERSTWDEFQRTTNLSSASAFERQLSASSSSSSRWRDDDRETYDDGIKDDTSDISSKSEGVSGGGFVGFRRGAFRGGRAFSTPSPSGSAGSDSNFGGDTSVASTASSRGYLQTRPTNSFGRGCIESVAAAANVGDSSSDVDDSSRADWRKKDQPLEWRRGLARGNEGARDKDDGGEDLWRVISYWLSVVFLLWSMP